MTDIVEELRQASLNQSDYRWEAADEIERLREDLRLAVMSDSEECKALSQEVEHLRLALEVAANDLDDWGAYTKAKNARAALEGE